MLAQKNLCNGKEKAASQLPRKLLSVFTSCGVSTIELHKTTHSVNVNWRNFFLNLKFNSVIIYVAKVNIPPPLTESSLTMIDKGSEDQTLYAKLDTPGREGGC